MRSWRLDFGRLFACFSAAFVWGPRVRQSLLLTSLIGFIFVLACPRSEPAPGGAATESATDSAPLAQAQAGANSGTIDPGLQNKKPGQLAVDDEDQGSRGALADNVTLFNAQRFAVQVYASQDADDARGRAKRLAALGYDAREVEAQVADRGLWHRVIFGDWSSRMQAQVAGERYAQDLAARSICAAANDTGAVFVLRDDVFPMEVNLRLAAALNESALGQPAQVALVQDGVDNQPVWALLVVQGDSRVRVLDVTGATHRSWDRFDLSSCADCQHALAGQNPSAVKLAFAGQLDPDSADFVLLELRYGKAHIALWSSLAAGGMGQPRLAFPLSLSQSNQGQANQGQSNNWTLVEADGDPGFELLLLKNRWRQHEGTLCDVEQSPLLYDANAQGLIAMDSSYWAQLSATDPKKAAQVFDHSLRLAVIQHNSALLRPLVAYCTSASGTTDVARRSQLLQALQNNQQADAAIDQALVLADLLQARPVFGVALVTQVLAGLKRLNADPVLQVPTQSCDEKPLARAQQWSTDDVTPWLEKGPWRHDLRRLPPEFFAAMARRYGQDTPVGQSLKRLAQKLKPASAIYAKVKHNLDQAWNTPAPR